MRMLAFLGMVLLSSMGYTGTVAAASSIPVYTPGQPFVVQGREANGGLVDAYLGTVSLFRKDRTPVVLEKHCFSSCTLYTALLKDGLLCARPGTVLGFHEYVEAEQLDIVGGTLRSYRVIGPMQGTKLERILRAYPKQVMRAIEAAGGFPPHHGPLLVLSAKQLGIPTC